MFIYLTGQIREQLLRGNVMGACFLLDKARAVAIGAIEKKVAHDLANEIQAAIFEQTLDGLDRIAANN